MGGDNGFLRFRPKITFGSRIPAKPQPPGRSCQYFARAARLRLASGSADGTLGRLLGGICSARPVGSGYRISFRLSHREPTMKLQNRISFADGWAALAIKLGSRIDVRHRCAPVPCPCLGAADRLSAASMIASAANPADQLARSDAAPWVPAQTADKASFSSLVRSWLHVHLADAKMPRRFAGALRARGLA